MSLMASDVAVNDRYEEVTDLSLLAVDQYLREVRWIKCLPDEEVTRLLHQVYRGRGAREQSSPNQWRLRIAAHAREQLVESYQPLVLFLARLRVSFYRTMELLDVVQEGNVGLLLALEQWTPEVGAFTPFAYGSIKHEMWASFYRSDRAIVVSERVRNQLSKLSGLITTVSAALDRAPTPQEIGQEMGVSAQRASDLLCWRREGQVESVEAVQSRLLAPDREPFCSLFAVPAGEETPQWLCRVMRAALEMLTPQQRNVIEARYGFGEGGSEVCSLKRVSELLGISCAQAARLEVKALKHLAFFLAPLAASGSRSVGSVVQVPSYYTVKEVAALLGLSASKVFAQLHGGELEAVFHGNKWYVPKIALEKHLDQRRRQEVC